MQAENQKQKKMDEKSPLIHKYKFENEFHHIDLYTMWHTCGSQTTTQIVSVFDTLFAWWRVENWKTKAERESERLETKT